MPLIDALYQKGQRLDLCLIDIFLFVLDYEASLINMHELYIVGFCLIDFIINVLRKEEDSETQNWRRALLK